MKEEAAFLTAIQTDPADDTVKLVFADWLDEHDQPEHAAALRAAVEEGRTPKPVPPPAQKVWADSSHLNSTDPAYVQRKIDALVERAKQKVAAGGRVNMAEAFFLSVSTKKG